MKRFLKILGIILLTVIIVIIYARYFGTKGFITNEIVIHDKNVPSTYDGIKIVHFSDIHYKRAIGDQKITSIIEEINLINPDIVVFTGDLIDETIVLSENDYNFLINSLLSINAKYGKYAVLGEHDYDKMDQVKEIYDESNFMYLENSHDIIEVNNDFIYIGGFGNATYNLFDKLEDYDDYYKIILMHEPDSIDTIKNDFDNAIFLAGHSHNGQFRLPLIGGLLKPKLGKKYYSNYYEIGSNKLYVSAGIGVSEFNYRLFNKPSINFYRINKD